MSFQTAEQLRVVSVDSLTACQHDDVHRRQTVTMSTETLSHDTLQAVPPNGTAHASLRDRQPQPRMTGVIVAEQDRKTPVTRSLRIAENPVELLLGKQAVLAPEGSGALRGFIHFPGCSPWRSNTPSTVRGSPLTEPFCLAVRPTGVSDPWPGVVSAPVCRRAWPYAHENRAFFCASCGSAGRCVSSFLKPAGKQRDRPRKRGRKGTQRIWPCQ